MESTARSSCPVCGAASSEPFFELSSVPVHCNIQHATAEQAIGASRGDLRLSFCDGCGMIHNRSFDPGRLEYGEEYENSLHGSPRFRRYLHDLAKDLVERHRVRQKHIVEVGCGDGRFLRLLCRAGQNQGIGFDPAVREVRRGPVHLRPGAFQASSVESPVALLCCRHVLEHLADPREFLREIRSLARRSPDMVVFLEVPDATYMLDQGGIWDVLYEHCSYFTSASLTRLLRSEGFRPLRATTSFEGQFLTVDAQPAQAADDTAAQGQTDVSEIGASVARFAAVFRASVARWAGWADEVRRQGLRVALWGAGTKGVMFLNMVGVEDLDLSVVDVNPRKTGRHVAGTGNRIESPEQLLNWKPDVVLVMNRAYTAEIRATLDRLGVRAELTTV